MPQAIRAFIESEDYEDAIRKAISIGGDSDTIACKKGGIAEAYYKRVPVYIVEQVGPILDERFNRIVSEFRTKYII